jgi:hypothetical protein
MDQETNLPTITMDDVAILCKYNKAAEAQLVLIAESRINTEQKGTTNGIRNEDKQKINDKK